MNTWLIILFASLATALGGTLALRFSRYLHLFNAFTAGILLGVVFFEILPEAVELHGDFLTVSIAILLGFLVFYTLQRFTLIHACHDHCDENDTHTHHVGVIGATGLAIHRFLDGAVIGLGFDIDPRVGLLIAIAVITHGIGDGIGTVTIMLKHKNTKRRTAAILAVASLTPFLGAIVGLGITLVQSTLALLLAFFAGFFLYLSTADLLPEAHARRHSYLTVFATILGVAAMYAVAVLVQ